MKAQPIVLRELPYVPDKWIDADKRDAIGTDGSINLDKTRTVADVRNGYSYFEDGDVAFAKVMHLDRETARIDDIIRKAERNIELLKERRGALITAAVTGQIDLREAVPPMENACCQNWPRR